MTIDASNCFNWIAHDFIETNVNETSFFLFSKQGATILDDVVHATSKRLFVCARRNAEFVALTWICAPATNKSLQRRVRSTALCRSSMSDNKTSVRNSICQNIELNWMSNTLEDPTRSCISISSFKISLFDLIWKKINIMSFFIFRRKKEKKSNRNKKTSHQINIWWWRWNSRFNTMTKFIFLFDWHANASVQQQSKVVGQLTTLLWRRFMKHETSQMFVTLMISQQNYKIELSFNLLFPSTNQMKKHISTINPSI